MASTIHALEPLAATVGCAIEALASGLGTLTSGLLETGALEALESLVSLCAVGALEICAIGGAPTRTHELLAVNFPDAVHARLPTSKLGSLSSNPVSHANEHGTFSVSMIGHAMFRAFCGILGLGPWQ